MNSVNPYRLEGQKTGRLRADRGARPGTRDSRFALRWRRQHCCLFQGLQRSRREECPASHCSQAEHRSTTVASAIRIAEPVHADEVDEAIAGSKGEIVTVTDEQILAAWKDLASHEGIFCEPASAAGIAALGVKPARARVARRLHRHRARAQGPGHRDQAQRRTDSGRSGSRLDRTRGKVNVRFEPRLRAPISGRVSTAPGWRSSSGTSSS